MMVALRVREDRVSLVGRMGQEARAQGRTAAAELYKARAAEYARYAETLRAATIRSVASSAEVEPG